MCNKMCNCLFSVVLTKRPALDALLVWTVRILWPVSKRPASGRFDVLNKLDAAGGLVNYTVILQCAAERFFRRQIRLWQSSFVSKIALNVYH